MQTDMTFLENYSAIIIKIRNAHDPEVYRLYIFTSLMDIAKLSPRMAIPIHFPINRAQEPVALYPLQYWLYSFLKIIVKPVGKKSIYLFSFDY